MTDKKDLGAQIEFSASADGMKAGVDAANKSIASIGATAEYVGNKSSASLDKIGGAAEKSAKQVAAVTRRIAAQADRALATIDASGSVATQLESNARRAGANYEKLAEKINLVAEAERRAKAASVLNQINAVGSTINDNGTLRSRADLLALRAAQAGVGKEAEAALAKIRLFDAGTGQLGKNAFATRNRLLTLQYTISDIAASAASGISPLTILLQQGGQVFDAFGGANAGKGSFIKNFFGSIAAVLTPMRLLIGGVAGSVATLGYAFYKGSQQSKEFADSLVLTGNYAGITEGQFNALAKSVAAGGQVTVASARATAQALISTGEIGQAQLGAATEAAGRYEKATGKNAATVAAEFAALTRDVSAGAATMNRSLHILTTSQVQHIQLLQDQGRETEAFGVVLNALNERLKGVEPNLGYIERALRSASHAWSDFWDAAFDIGRTETIDDKIKKVQDDLKQSRGTTNALDIFGFKAKAEAALQEQERELFRAKEKQDGAAAAQAAVADEDRRASAANAYYRAAEKGAKAQIGLTRELAEEERQYQALRARKITDPNIELPSKETRDAIQKRIRDSYADKSSGRGARDAAKEEAQVLKAQRDSELEGVAESLRRERAAYSFQNQYLSNIYQQSLISLDDYYAQRKSAADDDAKAQTESFAESIRILEKYKAQIKDPSDKVATQTKIDKTEAAAREAELNRQRESVGLDIERANALRQLGDRVSEYRAQLLALQGDEAGAAKIRTDLAIANAKLFATTAGGRVSDAEVQNQERLLRIADEFSDLLRRNTQLTNAAASAERAYLLISEQTGASLLDTEANIYAIRAKALPQLAEQARLARELAAANQGNADLQQRAVDLTQQYAEALYYVDPALNRLRESAKSTADAITDDIANALMDFKGFRPLLDSIANDLLKASTDLLITQPLKKSLEGIFTDIATGDNLLGDLLKGGVGVQGAGGYAAEATKTAAITAQTTATLSSTTALTALASAAASASIALGGKSASSGLDSILGLFGGSSASTAYDSWQFHSGGIVGQGGTARTVPASVFAGARRFHGGGLASGEVPAILMGGPKGKREEVLTANDPRHSDNGGGRAQYLNITIAPPAGMTPQTSAQFARDAGRQISIAVARGNS